MSLGYIINEVCGPVGLTSLSLNPEQRTWIINKINRAAEEFYESEDIPGCLRECFVQAKSNVELALPSFVGKLRAVRLANFKESLRLIDLRPRYHHNPWLNEWKLFHYKGISPVKFDIVNATAPLALIDTADSTVEVTIVGSTINANRVSETVSLSTTSNAFTKAFISYESITLNKLASFNITIVDGNDNELAVIPNDSLEARYQLYDISLYPYSGQTSTTDCYVFEMLYKLPLKRLENDSDSFPVPGFDNVIIVKTLQLLTEMEEGKEERAILMDRKAARLVKQKVEDETGSVEKVLNYPRRGTLGLFSHSNYDRLIE